MTAAAPAAPTPPGSLADPPDARALLAYLPALLDWRDRLRARLDDLDRRCRATDDPARLAADVTLAYALWHSISTRVDAVVTVWDRGRVHDREREQIARLLWGRLAGDVDVVLAVSFVEACVLADALADRLSDELVAGSVDVVPPGARDERDDVDASASRSAIANDRARLGDRLARAVQHAERVAAIAVECRREISGAPNLAVPDPTVLGRVPAPTGDRRSERAALDELDARLTRVEESLREAERRYRQPLAKRDELRGLLGAYRAMAASRGRSDDAKLHDVYRHAHTVLWSAPVDLGEAERMVSAYEAAVRGTDSPPQPPGGRA